MTTIFFFLHILLALKCPMRPKSTIHGLWMLSRMAPRFLLARQQILCYEARPVHLKKQAAVWTTVYPDGKSTLSGKDWGYLQTLMGLDLGMLTLGLIWQAGRDCGLASSISRILRTHESCPPNCKQTMPKRSQELFHQNTSTKAYPLRPFHFSNRWWILICSSNISVRLRATSLTVVFVVF